MQEDLFIFVPSKSEPGIMLSGGADSSLLLWILAQQDVYIKTFTIERKQGILEHTKKIIDWINNHLNRQIPYPIMVGDATAHHSVQIRLASREIFRKNLASHLYFGITQNPPMQIVGAPVRHPIINNPRLLAPFWNYDKRDITKLYRHYKIIDLFEITKSCQIYTDKHCGDCFHCKERDWGLQHGI